MESKSPTQEASLFLPGLSGTSFTLQWNAVCMFKI